MPTGYTASISEGISFKNFVLQCSRAFGALIEMRDDPMDAEIPDEFPPSNYHIDEVSELKKRLSFIEGLSLEEAHKECEDEYISELGDYNKTISDKNELKEKYNIMLNEVNSWTPPTDEHKGLKDFMVKQITESIDWDCKVYSKRPTPKNAELWIAEQKESILKDIVYHETEYEKEVKRCKDRSEWVRKLKISLK